MPSTPCVHMHKINMMNVTVHDVHVYVLQWVCFCSITDSSVYIYPVTPAMASPEYRALHRSTNTLCELISDVSPELFAQLLWGRGLITRQLHDGTLMLDVSDYDKVRHLLQAVAEKVKTNPGTFSDLVEILSQESVLEACATLLTDALNGRYVWKGVI